MRTDVVRAAVRAEIAAATARLGGGGPAVLDVGGGTGHWAVPLASAGCVVTVVDPSPDALAVLRRRAVEAGCAERVTGVQGDTDVLADVVPAGAADLVLAHGVLEFVDDVARAAAALAGAAAPGGALSVVVANRYAAVLARALAGRVTEAVRVLDDGVAAGAGERRLLDSRQLGDLLTAAGLRVELLQGDGVAAGLVPRGDGPDADEALAALEERAARVPALRDVAARLHAVARRPV